MHAYQTETIGHEGRQFRVSLYSDDCADTPWQRATGHGECELIGDSDPIPRGWVYLADLQRGRWIYNFGAAIVQAARDKWGLSPEDSARLAARLGKKPTRAQMRAESVRADMRFLAGWCRGDWGYIGVCVQILDSEGVPIGGRFDHAVWGVESCGDYWETVARELADEILHERRKTWRAALAETRARRYWESRDVQTVGGLNREHARQYPIGLLGSGPRIPGRR